MPVIQKYKVQLGNNIFAQMEEHPSTEIPQYYPRHISGLGQGILILVEPRGSDYVPTPKEKAELIKKVRAVKSWYYLRFDPSRTRED